MEIVNPCFEDGQKDDGRVQYKKRPVRVEVNRTRMTHKTDNKKSSITAVFILIVFIVQILIMAAALSLAVYSHMKIQTYNGPIKFLNTQTDLILWQMKQMDSQLQAKIELVRDSLNHSLEVFRTSITRELNTLNTTTMGQLSNLQSSVNTLNTTTMDQLSDLQSSVNTLNTTTMGQLIDLQSSVNTLTNSPVDFYQGCVQHTRTCTSLAGGVSNYIWYGCPTSGLYINPTVSW